MKSDRTGIAYPEPIDLPDLVPVNSTNLRAIGYRAEDATLFVEFQNGHLYEYPGVPALVHRTLMTTDSAGRYFTVKVKPNYRGRQLR